MQRSSAMLTAVVCLAVGSSALAGAPSPASAEDAPISAFVGSYRDVSSERESKSNIEEAIDRAVAPMSFLLRPIARRRLAAINPAYEHVRITEHGGELVTDFEGRRYAARSDGAPRRNLDEDGSKVDVSYRIEGRTLHARYVAGDGEKRYEFALEPDGRTLHVHVQVLSSRLPEPVSYRLTYVRAQ